MSDEQRRTLEYMIEHHEHFGTYAIESIRAALAEIDRLTAALAASQQREASLRETLARVGTRLADSAAIFTWEDGSCPPDYEVLRRYGAEAITSVLYEAVSDDIEAALLTTGGSDNGNV